MFIYVCICIHVLESSSVVDPALVEIHMYVRCICVIYMYIYVYVCICIFMYIHVYIYWSQTLVVILPQLRYICMYNKLV